MLTVGAIIIGNPMGLPGRKPAGYITAFSSNVLRRRDRRYRRTLVIESELRANSFVVLISTKYSLIVLAAIVKKDAFAASGATIALFPPSQFLLELIPDTGLRAGQGRLDIDSDSQDQERPKGGCVEFHFLHLSGLRVEIKESWRKEETNRRGL